MSVGLPQETVQEKRLICSELRPFLPMDLTVIVTDYYFSAHHIDYQRHIPERITTILTRSLGPISSWPAPLTLQRLPNVDGTLFCTSDVTEASITFDIRCPFLPSENDAGFSWREGYDFGNQVLVRSYQKINDNEQGTRRYTRTPPHLYQKDLDKAVEDLEMQLKRRAFDNEVKKAIALFNNGFLPFL